MVDPLCGVIMVGQLLSTCSCDLPTLLVMVSRICGLELLCSKLETHTPLALKQFSLLVLPISLSRNNYIIIEFMSSSVVMQKWHFQRALVRFLKPPISYIAGLSREQTDTDLWKWRTPLAVTNFTPSSCAVGICHHLHEH